VSEGVERPLTVEDAHAVMVLDGAGWHGAKALAIPPHVTLVPLPPYSPQINPMERFWFYLRERFPSLRVLQGYEAIVDACCLAWNAIADDADHIRSLCLYPYIQKVISYARRYYRRHSGVHQSSLQPSHFNDCRCALSVVKF
jgi:hypothetical protein